MRAMIPIHDFAAIHEAMHRVKKNSEVVKTNFYALPAKAQPWMTRNELFLFMPIEHCFLLLRRDRTFWHLYFYSASIECLGASIHLLSSAAKETIVTDLLGRQADVEPLIDQFRYLGFQNRTTLHRMTRIVESPYWSADKAAGAGLATASDPLLILEILERSFDSYSEQIPPIDEIKAMVDGGNVLTVCKEENITGLLFFEVAGYTSILLRWWVAEAYRGYGIGSRLMHAYFEKCPNVKRFMLWVITTNEEAITRYCHYDYQEDGLVDQVMIK